MFDYLYRFNRLCIKIAGVLAKLSSYIVYFLKPGLRFKIPSQALPFRNHSFSSEITPIVWQTNFTAMVTLPVFLNYLFNRLLSLGTTYRFMSTEERDKFIAAHFSDREVHAYRSLQIGAAQADFWRVAVLYIHGGVYMDIDAHLIRPLSSLTRNRKEIFLLTRDREITNYFIASAPGNPKLQSLINAIVDNIEKKSSDNVYDLTGPGVFNATLCPTSLDTDFHWRTCNQGTFTNEHFQYMDRPGGKWTRQQSNVQPIKDQTSSGDRA